MKGRSRMAFTPGTLVMLKSGGPIMTVKEVRDNGVVCEWFDGKQEPQVRVFAATSLEEYKPGAGGYVA
jgi:uncharacterized protein YodC (DUF2158 family)